MSLCNINNILSFDDCECIYCGNNSTCLLVEVEAYCTEFVCLNCLKGLSDDKE